MKDKILRMCLVLLVVFLLLSFGLVDETKREIGNRKEWAEVFKEINRWDLEKDLFYWESTHFEPDEGRTLFITCDDDWHDTDLIYDNGEMIIVDENFGADRLYGGIISETSKDTIYIIIIDDRKTTYLGIDSTKKNLYFHNK